jgi:hypothetical protein
VNPDQSRKVLLTAPSATGLALLQALRDAHLRNAGEAA